jgi:hypothetical protein
MWVDDMYITFDLKWLLITSYEYWTNVERDDGWRRAVRDISKKEVRVNWK